MNEAEKERLDELKYTARAQLTYAISKGAIKKMPCRECGEVNVHGHHTDYSKPLDVVWLCRKHHVEEHHRLGSYKNRPKKSIPIRKEPSKMILIRVSKEEKERILQNAKAYAKGNLSLWLRYASIHHKPLRSPPEGG